MRTTLAIGLFLAVTCFHATAADRTDLSQFRLTMAGLGPVRNGMTIEQLRRAGFRLATPSSGDFSDCAQARILGQEDVGLLIENNRVTRIELYSNRIYSLSGSRIGDTEDEIEMTYKKYGDSLSVEPHPFDHQGRVVKIFSPDQTTSIAFEIHGHVVTQIYAGPAAGYVEGCL
ncbi:MAG: hypothetical protein ABI866_06090 [Dokdonella sp.]